MIYSYVLLNGSGADGGIDSGRKLGEPHPVAHHDRAEQHAADQGGVPT